VLPGAAQPKEDKPMYLDKENIFSMSAAITATASSENTIDLGRGDAGPSERLSLFVTIDTPYTGAGTLIVNLQTADAVGTDGSLTSPVTVASYPVANADMLAAGQIIASRLPHGCKRYMRLNYAVSGTISAGKITAGLVWDVQAEDPIPTGPSGI
jgi:hypothetical protein